MKKVKVIQPFYEKLNAELYVDDERCEELKEKGLVKEEVKYEEEIIQTMSSKIKHRGPDDEGFYINDNIALAHQRLAIIDLTNGKQPMFNEDKTKVLIFNGEIYNFKELKKILIKDGYKFKSKI